MTRVRKLSPLAVVLMQYMHRRGANYAQLSRAFGVAQRTAKFAVIGLIWKNALDVTERAKQPLIGGSVAGVLSPLLGVLLGSLGRIDRNFSSWNKTALYMNRRRMPWTYRVPWIQDIGGPSHPNPNEGTHPMPDNKDKLPSLDMERAKPLRDWLNERNARCAWQVVATKQNPRTIEGWIVNGHVVIIVCAEYGWELWTQPSTNNIESTLIDAERRIGLDPPPTLAKQSPSLTGIGKVTP